MKALNIVESAYRATVEEQDDTIIWLSHAMKGAGAQLDVLLRANAVNYTVKGQDASGLAFGEWKQTEPPRIDHEVAGLIKKGVAVYVVAEDLAERGLEEEELIAGVQPVSRDQLATLVGSYDQVWHW